MTTSRSVGGTRRVTVLGPTSFNYGIGGVTAAACELLSRYYSVSLCPTTPCDIADIQGEEVVLPSGRVIPVSTDLSDCQVVFYTDVLWNGEDDRKYSRLPSGPLKIAHVAYDSDELPDKWVSILNTHFDVVLFMSQHLEEVAKRSGVSIPIGTLPLGLSLEAMLARPYRPPGALIRFGSLVAFHPRKELETLVEAYADEFAESEGAELCLHSNLAIGPTYDEVIRRVTLLGRSDVTVTHEDLSVSEKNRFLEDLDVFVNCSRGEGYSIGAREALALGKCLVLSDVGPHRDLTSAGLTGIHGVSADIQVPARYPEIDNRVFGQQHRVSKAELRRGLRHAFEECRTGVAANSQLPRRRLAEQFSHLSLAQAYAESISVGLAKSKPGLARSEFFRLPVDCIDRIEGLVGPFPELHNEPSRIVVPAHDGGFFSLFNVFMSHLVWEERNERCQMVLPDWDTGRLLRRLEKGPIQPTGMRYGESLRPVSFCYGSEEDGNIWLSLFEPLYGLTAEEMNDEDYLYEAARVPEDHFNSLREPWLTYVHANQLYQSPSFKGFRHHYHRLFHQHVRLLPQFRGEIDQFVARHFAGKYMIAVHIKHPSHAVEQPNGSLASSDVFINAVRDQVREAGLDASDDWAVFVATDQDRVIQQFVEAFGGRALFFGDARRVTQGQDEEFSQLPDADKKGNYQMQHIAAASPESWSTRLAWEVVRDAYAMAECQVLLHAVSNVSTAVSYINPSILMKHVIAP